MQAYPKMGFLAADEHFGGIRADLLRSGLLDGCYDVFSFFILPCLTVNLQGKCTL